MTRLSLVRRVLWVLVGIGLVAAVYRFAYGLGAATNLSDRVPWGLWIAFDVMAGVALAAGGFTIVLVVHVLNLERFRPLLRPAVLTALIGYVLAAVSIAFDLGQPQRIWHPLVYWNLRSPLWEVALCVMTYLTVLILEFAPAYFETRRWVRALRWMNLLLTPLAVAGIVLSTMHQSSLGALYLIAPGRLHPLWYTAQLPWLFFISAVAAGLAMVTVEVYWGARAFDHATDPSLLTSLAKATWWVLAVYGVYRLADLAATGRLARVAEGSLESTMFLIEVGAGVVLPLVLLAIPSVQTHLGKLVLAQSLVAAGVVLNRFNVVLVGMRGAMGGSYFPSLVEIAITIGMLAAGLLFYMWSVRNLPVFAAEAVGHD